ncbi:VanZ family protein [Micromonospora sp. NPDC005686]|uniref:VanZ family protein n=1 Tax=unclassified Micromonospora TaxID=2617518 RepID=UPI0033B532B3
MVEGWHGWFGTITGVVLLTVAALPAAALTVWVLARRRGGGAAAWRRSVAEVGIVYGTAPWVWMIMLPGERAGAVPGRVSLVPLRDLLTVLASGPLTATGQIVGNLLVFAALGFFAPLRFAALASVPRILALAAGCSVLVEVAQYVLRLDRVSSVDDVLLNAAGAGLAALASRRWWREPAEASPPATGAGSPMGARSG